MRKDAKIPRGTKDQIVQSIDTFFNKNPSSSTKSVHELAQDFKTLDANQKKFYIKGMDDSVSMSHSL